MKRRAFTLVELIVAIAVIAVLMAMIGAAASAARSNRKVAATRAMIAKLNLILTTQLLTYNSKDVGTSATTRASLIRCLITADMPDRWTDVAYMAGKATEYTAPPQRAYIGTYIVTPSITSQYAGAECLFMVIMQGGLANCLDCGTLKTIDIGDKDNDGAQEFWDSWGNPIDYILWPYAVELPAGSGSRFFSGSRLPADPNGTAPPPTLGLRPLIYSAGPDGEYGLERNNEASNLAALTNCGNWQTAPTITSAKTMNAAFARDNITNFDAEAKQ